MFISNGSIARYNVLTAYGDAKRPIETMRAFLIGKDAQGLNVGRIEKKLGQRLSTAVEILCEDVLVSEADSTSMSDGGRSIDSTLSLTRGPVGAMSTGIVRGTLERTLRYLSQRRVNGHWLFEEQWVQLQLADMFGALQAARGMYMDAALATDAWGVGGALRFMPSSLPGLLRSNRLFESVVGNSRLIARSRDLYRKLVPKAQLQRVVAHASLAKFMCRDLAVNTSMRAMEILGEDANDPQWGVEKCMRDAKLAQIFEGTNQINRLHVARGFLSRG